MSTKERTDASQVLARPFIVAKGLGLKTPMGTPYWDVNVEVPLGTLLAVTGVHGAGKTPLLMTLAGRMRFTKGSLVIDGNNLPKGSRKARKQAGLGLFRGLNDFEMNLKVRSVTAAELELFKKPHRKADVSAYLAGWGLEQLADLKVRELSEPDLVLLGIALGMAGDPKILAVDDVEHSLTHEQTRSLLATLRKLVDERNIIVMVALTEPSFASCADQVITLERGK